LPDRIPAAPSANNATGMPTCMCIDRVTALEDEDMASCATALEEAMEERWRRDTLAPLMRMESCF
jgi:hypothetical protein